VSGNSLARLPRTSTVILLLLAALLAPLATSAEESVVVPEELDHLDPAVRELVLKKVEEVRGAPGSARAHGMLGLVYEVSGLWDAARACFSRAAELAPGDRDWRLHHIVATRETGDVDGAREALLQLVADEPDFAPAQQRLGVWLLEVGDTAAAEGAFQRVVELAPNAAEGYAGLGEVLLRQRDYAGAAVILEAALERDDGLRTAHYLLGQAYRRLGRQEEALRELQAGVDAKPRFLPDRYSPDAARFAVNPVARIDQAERLLTAGRPWEAMEILEQVLEHHPDEVVALNKLAIAQAELGAFASAQATLQRAREIDEGHVATHVNLAAVATRTGRWDEALGHSRAAVERGPQNARAHRTKGGILISMGRFDEAIETLETAVTLDARDPSSRMMLADTLARMDRLEEAATQMDQTVSLWPDFFDAQIGLAHVSLRLGRVDRARAALEAARALQPADPQVATLARRLETVAGTQRERP
jgi:tetratricopeptide (TPR) repeat protein